jgi:Cu-Zn family superoxide dismutase
MSLRPIFIILAGSALTLCGCAKEQPAAPVENDLNMAEPAKPAAPAIPPLVQLVDTSGVGVGRIEMSEDPNGVTMKVIVSGLPAGSHGVHLHEVGRCDTADFFKSAGAHWNPANRQHGRDNPQGAHLGDLANFSISGPGETSATFLVGGVAYHGSAQSLADADGTSLVIHAKPDDYRTDPSGDSGDRIACAVLAPPAP